MKNLHSLDAYRVERPHFRQDEHTGYFKVMVGQHSFYVIASIDDCGEDGLWDHISVTPKNQNRCPTWDEMCAIKNMFFEPEEECVEFHPKQSQYINMHKNCLHIWRPITKTLTTPHVKTAQETIPKSPNRITYQDASGNWVIACNRLDNWVELKYPAHIRGEAVDRLAAYENSCVEPEDILAGKELAEIACAMDLLKRYLALGSVEDIQRILASGMTSCKCGDIVWRLVYDADPHITRDKIISVNADGSFTLIGGRIVHKSDFGTSIFCSEESATTALRNGGSQNESI